MSVTTLLTNENLTNAPIGTASQSVTLETCRGFALVNNSQYTIWLRVKGSNEILCQADPFRQYQDNISEVPLAVYAEVVSAGIGLPSKNYVQSVTLTQTFSTVPAGYQNTNAVPPALGGFVTNCLERSLCFGYNTNGNLTSYALQFSGIWYTGPSVPYDLYLVLSPVQEEFFTHNPMLGRFLYSNLAWQWQNDGGKNNTLFEIVENEGRIVSGYLPAQKAGTYYTLTGEIQYLNDTAAVLGYDLFESDEAGNYLAPVFRFRAHSLDLLPSGVNAGTWSWGTGWYLYNQNIYAASDSGEGTNILFPETLNDPTQVALVTAPTSNPNTTSDAFAKEVLSLAPTFWFRGQEPYGYKIWDNSGNGHNGTGQAIGWNAYSQIPGVAYLLGFAANNNKIDSLFEVVNQTSFSVMVHCNSWNWQSDTGYPRVAGSGHVDVSKYGFQLGCVQNKQQLQLWIGNSTATAYVTYGTNLVNNEWYQFVGTYNGSVLALYVNGVNVSSASVTIGTMVSRHTVRFMEQPGGDRFAGVMGDMAYWSGVALTATDVSNLWSSYQNSI